MSKGHEKVGTPPTLIYAIGRVDQGIRREMRMRLGPWELSVPEYTALSILERQPDLSNAQLARRTMVTPQSMIQILVGLEDRGLIERRADRAHARILRARLTKRGSGLLTEIEPVMESIAEQLFAALTKRERATLLSGMLTAMKLLSRGLDESDA